MIVPVLETGHGIWIYGDDRFIAITNERSGEVVIAERDENRSHRRSNKQDRIW